MNELDALANIDFNTRYEKDHLRQLELVRIGTCGGLQPYTPVGTYVCSEKSIGFDGLLNFYAGRNEVCDLKLEQTFIDYMGWEGNVCIAHPYVIDADRELIDRIAQNDMVRGVTIAAGGFLVRRDENSVSHWPILNRMKRLRNLNTMTIASLTLKWKVPPLPD